MAREMLPGFNRFVKLTNKLVPELFAVGELDNKSVEELTQLFTQRFAQIGAAVAQSNNFHYINQMERNLELICRNNQNLAAEMNRIVNIRDINQKKAALQAMIENQEFIALCANHVHRAMQDTHKETREQKIANKFRSGMIEDAKSCATQAGYGDYPKQIGKMLVNLFCFLVDIQMDTPGSDLEDGPDSEEKRS